VQPLSIAKELFTRADWPFEEDLARYLQHGYVCSSPERFLMFRPVDSSDPLKWVSWGKADAWWVQAAVGGPGIRWFLQMIPEVPSKIMWCRGFRGDGRRRLVDREQLLKHC
jgi:hypothetical protein